MAGIKGKSGGFRVGAGRKRRDAVAAWLGGHAGKREPKAGQRPVVAGGVSGNVFKPDDMMPEAAMVWDELAPFAVVEHTLTPATALAFAVLCRNIVLERKLAAAPLTVAGPDHRGMMQRVEAGMARFRLIPDGRPVVVQEAPKDEWAAFDGPMLVKGA